jgi:hypothetical protein
VYRVRSARIGHRAGWTRVHAFEGVRDRATNLLALCVALVRQSLVEALCAGLADPESALKERH